MDAGFGSLALSLYDTVIKKPPSNKICDFIRLNKEDYINSRPFLKGAHVIKRNRIQWNMVIRDN